RREKRPNADFLTVTSIVASLLLGNAHSALMILALSDLAELMTSYTIERTRSSIKKMLSADEGEAWKVLSDGKVERCPMAQIGTGDVVAVHTGEKISVDGKVVYGAAVVDQSPITGEFVPVEKREGDEVFAGTVVKSGTIHVQAAKVGDQTVISRIVGMVEASELKKAPIQRYADKFSNYLVPLNFLLCLSVWLVTKNPQKALKMLVIDYSCGIKLSTATAFSAAINTAVKQGVLIKGGTFIEQMSSANTVLLDKTGTITEGKPQVVSMALLKPEMTHAEVLSYAMAAEETSTHPLGDAIMRYGRQLGAQPLPHGDIITEVSRGSRTQADGKIVRVGNLKYMRENGVIAAGPLPQDTGAIPNYVGIDQEIVAVLYAMDSPRENVRRAINSLRYDGVGDIELLTGDLESQARTVAEQVGADGYRAQLLPEQKAEAVLKLQVQGNGVVMVGDGINDAPALAYADVGISMGSKSTDIAMETSDVIINRDDPMMIPALRRLARSTMRIVHQNFALVIAINSVGLILGAASGISVMMSALLHNSSTILVVANSLRLMFMKPGDGRA
ncbi:MAG: heavy metal translocating P-type ATPase, partial [Clostridiales bacterium]|nr:heavy metal translocating P-type ATPase [Clostridiales bacterium]